MVWTCGLSKDDAMVCGRWRKMIRMCDEQENVSGWMFLLVPAHPGRPGQRAVKRSCVCVCVCVCVGVCDWSATVHLITESRPRIQFND